MSHPLLATLNPDQQRVVQATSGPVLVLAGAGSGKTKALTHRIAYLLSEGLAGPDEILAVTFTNKAAREMKERVLSLLTSGARLPHAIGTFHSLGARILREQASATRRSPSFVILDTRESEHLIKVALAAQNLSPREWSPTTLRHAISRAKHEGVTPEQLLATAQGPAAQVTGTIYGSYQKQLIAHNAYDFDDLLLETVRLLQRESSIRGHYQQRWRYLSVDEYQDTNPIQEELLAALLGSDKHLCVVGDDYQAIYSWRGARVDHILDFEHRFPGCTTIYLTQNYRSTPAILQAANQVIAQNQVQKHKALWTTQGATTPVRLQALMSDRQEAIQVRQEIEQHIRGGGRASDCAILYRTNAQSRLFEEQFLMYQLPYTIVGGFRFYDRAEVKDALALLQLWVNPTSSLPLQRLSKSILPGIGPKTLARLTHEAAAANQPLLNWLTTTSTLTGRPRAAFTPLITAWQTASNIAPDQVAELLLHLVEGSGYRAYLQKEVDGEERWENIEELVNVAAGYHDVVAFTEAVALMSDIDAAPDREPGVMCLTLHAAKGLEFPRVWVVGCEEGLLPHQQSFDSVANIEEERRLLYVGITRARAHLTLTYAATRFVRGELLPQLPSRFLQDLPAEVARASNQDYLAHDNLLEPVNVSYDVGDFITHPQFGRGVVIQVQGSLITCVFAGQGLKTLASSAIVRHG